MRNHTCNQPLPRAAGKLATNIVVFACDEAYAMPLTTTLCSIVQANRSEDCHHIVVLTSQFSAHMKQRVIRSLPKESVSIRWRTVDLTRFEACWTRPYISKITYARLLLPDVLGINVSRLLYLDADLLVLDDLHAMWNMDLDGAPLGAVVDTESYAHSIRISLQAKTTDATSTLERVPLLSEYFNAGVLLIDAKRWREEQISEKALRYMARYPDAALADQDALNVACGGYWKRLDARWNRQDHKPFGYSRMPQAERPVIVHFAGRAKPWNATSLSVDAEFYDSFRSRTEFARTRRDKTLDIAKRIYVRLRAYLRQCKYVYILYNRIKTFAK